MADPNDEKILLSVSLITYNQHEFITKAIESIIIQKTNFKYEIIIGDDFSTDGTREICIEYMKRFPNFIKLRLPERNIGFINNMKENLLLCKGEFIALLEGDDYWIDPNKLQRQVDYLTNNPRCGVVCTNYLVYHTDTKDKKIASEFYKTQKLIENFDYSMSELLEHNFVGPLTAVFRNKNLNFKELLNPEYKTGDYPIWLELSSKYTINYLDICTAVYRYIPNSLSHKTNKYESFKFGISVENIRYKYAVQNNYDEKLTEQYKILKKYQLDFAFEMNDKSFYKDAYNELNKLDPEYITFPRKIKMAIIGNNVLVKGFLSLKKIKSILKKISKIENNFHNVR